MIPATPALAAALAALDSHTEWGRELRELAVGSGGDWAGVLGALRAALRPDKPMRTQVAVVQFLDAVWDARLSVFDRQDADAADRVLCGIAHATDALRPFLDSWTARLDLDAMRHLAQFVNTNVDRIASRGTLRDPSWTTSPGAARGVVAWLHETAVADGLELAAFAAIDAVIRAEFAAAIDRLRRLQPAG